MHHRNALYHRELTNQNAPLGIIPFDIAELRANYLKGGWFYAGGGGGCAASASPGFVGWLKLVFYGTSRHVMSFRARSINLATLFLGKPPRKFTST